MPSRLTLSPSPQPSRHHTRHHKLPTPIAACTSLAGAAASLFFLLTVLLRKLKRRRRPSTSPLPPPHHFSYYTLRSATSHFSPSRLLGRGGFGSVYRAELKPSRPGPTTGRSVAVKLMDSGSLHGEREFNNEVFFASKLDSPYVVKVLGFCSEPKRRHMLVVYELMCNGNLQDALLVKKCEELRFWDKRFCVAVDIANAIDYLHGLDPVVVHGDIKPSNVLLDVEFRAKIADFGLARLKECDQFEASVLGNGVEEGEGEESGLEESESVATTTVFEEGNSGVVDQSPESFVRVAITMSPETVECIGPVTSPEMGGLDKSGLDYGKRDGKGVRSGSVKDWWWKQEGGGGGGTGIVKDYVMEWLGSEIKKERPNGNLVGVSASTSGDNVGKLEIKKTRRRLDWWISMDDEMTKKNLRKDKRRPVREWWKDDFRNELVKKKKKKKKQQIEFYSDDNCGEDWWRRDEESYSEKKKKSKNRSSSRGSVDWWLDGMSGELWKARRNSYDSMSGEIPKSGGISSTPSMRGTVCYVAPEYGGGEDLSEKCDVYSYGVLLLVLIAGRRPLQVTGSPLAEFQRANLISWARHLARKNKLRDLVDKNIVSLDHEKALLCIIVALNCLQKSPEARPSMKEVVGMLTGQLDPPHLPIELSPSPPSCYKYKSHKKVR